MSDLKLITFIQENFGGLMSVFALDSKLLQTGDHVFESHGLGVVYGTNDS